MRNGLALFQLWFVGTAVWMIGWVILINSSCAPGAGDLLVCSPAFLQRLASVVSGVSVTFAQLMLCGFAVPVAVLLAGALLYRLTGAGRPR
ncbi:MAG: hypothetical protein U1E23_01095 [Reyranellaceae bacterium]